MRIDHATWWALAAVATITACGGSSEGMTPGSTCDLPNVPAAQCAAAKQLLLPEALPPARGNKYGDDEDAAYLGFYLFFTTDLGTGVGCPTCHVPELAFTDRKSVSMGKFLGERNAPTTFNASRMNVIFWDGRTDALWSQPLFAIENPKEMASTRLTLAHFVADDANFRARYEKVFGPLPAMDAWPATGKPGDAAFDALPAETKDQVNRVAANIGKSFEAYMRRNTTSASALDRFLSGDHTALIEPAQRGLGVFLKNDCQSCHSGPMLSDEKFHDAKFPSLPGAAPDRGRAGGREAFAANIFTLSGPYADPGPGVPGAPATDTGGEGAFRTPPLRNITRTAPYGHDGALLSLPDVLAIHAPNLSADDRGDLLAFFETLNGEYPHPPWNDWPARL
jgi:cytochrome c peroxidase